MSSGPDIRAGILRNKRPDYQNSTLTSRATIHDLDLDRRSLLRDERYGTTSTYMSEHQTGTVFIRVSVAELKVQVEVQSSAYCFLLVGLVISVYLSSLPVAHLSDAPRRWLVVTGDSARIQDETTENSTCFFNVLSV